MAVTILIADDHKIMRDGLCSMLSQQKDIQVVGEADNGRKAVSLVRKLKPEVVIMDITMPDLNGIDATHQILSESPETRIIALSMHSDKRFVAEMFKAGANGYLLKECAFQELVQAIHSVVANKTFLSPGIAGLIMEDYVAQLTQAECNPNELTSREREVLQLISEGRTTKQIAEAMNVSVKTVETHRRKIMKKLKVHSVAELTKAAILKGLTTVES
jgi:DNA-binding NarL/FixJ family response regulator